MKLPDGPPNDEIVTEVPRGQDDLEEFELLMAETSYSAKDFPVKA
jgi:hypothetical protein